MKDGIVSVEYEEGAGPDLSNEHRLVKNITLTYSSGKKMLATQPLYSNYLEILKSKDKEKTIEEGYIHFFDVKSELIKDKTCDLDFLVGKTITNIGFTDACEGGLTIEYFESGDLKRAILGFTDLGMWIEAIV